MHVKNTVGGLHLPSCGPRRVRQVVDEDGQLLIVGLCYAVSWGHVNPLAQAEIDESTPGPLREEIHFRAAQATLPPSCRTRSRCRPAGSAGAWSRPFPDRIVHYCSQTRRWATP